MTRHGNAFLAACLTGLLGSCATQQKTPPEPSSKLNADRSALDVQSLVMKMADEYSVALTEAMRPIIIDPASDSTARQSAKWIQRNGMGSAIDIAVGSNPDSALLDLLVLASLQHWSLSKHWAEAGIPPSHAGAAEERLRLAEESAWRSAATVLTDAQQRALRALIDAWIRENPDRIMVAFVRFDEFVNIRHDQALADQSVAEGMLREVAETGAAIDSARLLGERALWYAARYPFVLGQQFESTYYQLADQPEIRAAVEAVQTMKQLSGSLTARADSLEKDLTAQQEVLFTKLAAERAAAIDQLKISLTDIVHDAAEDINHRTDATVTQAFDRLAVERGKLLDDLESRQESLRVLMTDVRSAVEASSGLATQLTGTANAVDRIVARFDVEPTTGRAALDLKDVRDAAIEATKAAQTLTALLQQATTLAESDIWEQRLSRLDHSTTGLIDRAFWRGLALVAALLAGLALIRFLPQRVRPAPMPLTP